jgi:broad specificity phosphatase PhoE
MPPCHLILIRHGHTAGNDSGPNAPMSGWTDVPLSARGRCQAYALGRHLAANVSFDAMYSSPLDRALETARIALGSLDEVRWCDGLREIACGDVDGMPVGEVEARYPERWHANLRQEDDHFRWPGGESYQELRDRCLATIRAIARAHGGQRVLVFTHAGVISQVLGALHHVRAARWESFRPSNASLTYVDWQGDEGELAGSYDLLVPLMLADGGSRVARSARAR